MGKTVRKARLRDDTVRIVADMHGVSISYVKKVRSGERENEDILASLIEYQRGKSQLIKEIERLIPVTSNPAKYGRG